MPEVSDVYVDQILTNISIQYKNSGFVADQIFPIVGVKKDSGKYFIYEKSGRFTIPKTLRAPKSESRQVDWKVSTGSYSAEEYALNDLIDDRERDNAAEPLNLEFDTVEFLTDLILLDYEKRVVDIVTDTSQITQNVTLSGTNQWSDYANSNPIDDIETGKSTIAKAIMQDPNVLVLGREVYDKLKHHPDILDRIKYTQKGVATPDLLASIFDIEKVLVANSIYNTAKEGQTPSYTYLWGKNALLAYVSPTPGVRKVSLGYTFVSRKRQVRKARDEKKHSTWIEVSVVQDEKLVAASCGYLIKAAVA